MNNDVKTQVDQPHLKNAFSTRGVVVVSVLGFIVLSAAIVFFFDVIQEQGSTLVKTLGPEFFLFVLGGFIAQMIDGSLGI